MSAIRTSIQRTITDLLASPNFLLTDEEKQKLQRLDIVPFSKAQIDPNKYKKNQNQNESQSPNPWDQMMKYSENQTVQNQTNEPNQQARRALVYASVNQKSGNSSLVSRDSNNLIQEVKINPNDLVNGYDPTNAGSHSGDPDGNTNPDIDTQDHGQDSLLAWAQQNAKSLNDISLADRLDLVNKASKFERDKLNHFTDGQGIAQLGSHNGTGLDQRNWFTLMRMQGDQFIGLAKAKEPNLSDQGARDKARSLLINRVKDYTIAGISDGNLIAVLIGKGMTAQQWRENPEEQARYNRYQQAKSGAYGWDSMMRDLQDVDIAFVEKFTGIDKRNANLFTENLFYESYANIDKLSKDLHYFQDKALGFNLIFACDVSQDHNGALHMNQGSLTGLAADDRNPTIVMSPRNDEDMMRMIFRLSFIPKDKSANGKEWLGRELNKDEQSLMKMLANNSLSSEEKISRFNEYLDNNGLEKNIGVANYMLKGHGWSGGIALHDNGTYDNEDKGIMALMGLSISANVDQARIHQQSCSTAEGGERSNIAVGNNIMNDFAPSTTKVVSVGASVVAWNGQGDHYQYASWIHGNMVNEGFITSKQYYERTGLNDKIRQEEKDALSLWTRNEDGITVKKYEIV
ncbi:MAG: hypothetical protein RLZZ361_709 [Cyanobacteriota bacterium]|jgi:hypothetical protein